MFVILLRWRAIANDVKWQHVLNMRCSNFESMMPMVVYDQELVRKVC